MNGTDLARTVARATGLPVREVLPVQKAALAAIMDSVLAGERVTLMHFGSFCLAPSRRGEYNDPRGGGRVKMAPRHRVRFIPCEFFRNCAGCGPVTRCPETETEADAADVTGRTE